MKKKQNKTKQAVALHHQTLKKSCLSPTSEANPTLPASAIHQSNHRGESVFGLYLYGVTGVIL